MKGSKEEEKKRSNDARSRKERVLIVWYINESSGRSIEKEQKTCVG